MEQARALLYRRQLRSYEVLKDERRAQLKPPTRISRTASSSWKAFINRFRAQATKAKQVQSRIKELEKIERIEIPPEEKTIHFSFPQPKPSGRIVAEFQKVAKSYGEKHRVFEGDFVIERGDRVALVGVNGAGKSTMIKILAGAEPVTVGRIHARAQRPARLLRAGSIQGARSERAHARRSGERWRRARRIPSCARCWAASCSPRTMCSSRSACCRAASAIGTRWRGC